ncbi:hypothetical protein HY993_01840 [Candidatus Micrarchaeota archaeon]|nr:hypothetical protein [Candidatus Micrarchaeota archaeon]
MFRRVLLIAAVTLLFVPFVNAAAYSTSEKPGDFCNPATAVFNSASGECNYRNNNIFSGIKAGKECYALVDKSFSCTDAAYGKYKNGYANDGTYYEFGSFTVTGAGWDDKAKSCSYTTTGCSASYVPKAQVSPSIKASSSQNYFPAPEQTQGNYDYGCSLWATPSVVLAGQSVFVYIQRYTNTAKNSFSIGGTVDCGNGRLQLATCNGAACYSVCKYNYDGDYAINGFVKGSFCSPAFVSVTSDYSNGGYGNYPVQPISTPKPDFTKPAVSLSKTPSGKVYQDSPITLKAAA